MTVWTVIDVLPFVPTLYDLWLLPLDRGKQAKENKMAAAVCAQTSMTMPPVCPSRRCVAGSGQQDAGELIALLSINILLFCYVCLNILKKSSNYWYRKHIYATVTVICVQNWEQWVQLARLL